MKNICRFLVILLCTFDLNAQDRENPLLTDTVTGYFMEQLKQYPQEKLYLQTDKPHYISGEKLWFRAHKVDALVHWKTNTSRYVYVELISPLDSAVCRVKIHPDSLALFHGYIPLDEGLPEGNYTLRAYTRYMENQGEDYFFRKTLPVFDPLSLRFDAHTAFSFDGKDVKVSFRFVDKQSGHSFEPENLTARLNRNAEKKLSFDDDTTTTVTFRIPEKEKLRVITLAFLYDGKKYTKYIQAPSPEDDFDVSFLPEGGYLLAGTNNTVAFKSIKSSGLSEDVACTIMDGKGEIIRKTQSLHLGMGAFDLYPESGQKYIVECTNGKNMTKRFELPSAVTGHCGLKVKRIQNKVYVAVNRSIDYRPPSEIYLLVHIRGGVMYNEKWDPEKEYLIFENSYFPSGVSQFVLYNAEKQVISERIIFNYSDNEIPRLTFSTDRDNYAAKQHIVSNVKITDINDTPLSGNFSVSVTDDKDITPDSCDNIIAAFLLTSELKGHIENPSYYLQQSSKEAANALDLLMMTQGWRRYAVPEIVRGELSAPEIPVEESQIIAGKLDGMFTSVKDGYISVLAMKDSAVNSHVAQTGQKGRFELKDIDYPDSTRFIIQAMTKKGGTRVFLEVDEPQPFPAANGLISSRELFPENLPDGYIAKADEKYLSENGMRIVNLAEVVVTARKTAQTSSAYYSAVTSSQVITAADIEKSHYTDMKMLLLQISGIMIIGDNISVRGGGAPLVVIDDAPDENFDLLSMEVSDIADVFLIKDASAGTMFGPKASSGALIITTKRGFIQKRSKSHNISNFFEPLGFQESLEFYSPKYEVSQRNTVTDLRSTIYWKPNVSVSETGEVSFDFYSADAETTYSVVIEGVSDQGHLIYKKEKIQRTEKIFR
ncbi:MAG: TonB-dependent receptor plug domain-containing protein [Tannerella sp.]|nr:TonB-dependent receptor plug domain-containing protein [Tannerella sp.]